MSDSLNTVQREAYRYIREHRKIFNKLLYRSWGRNIYRANTHPTQKLPYDDNPNLGAEMVKFMDVLAEISFHDKIYGLSQKDYLKVWLKIKPIFIKKALLPRVRSRDGKFPEETKTNAMKELLARGFVHYQDAPSRMYAGWVVEGHIGDLIWPHIFMEQKDALELMGRFGIPGYTGVKQLKQSK